VPFRGGGIEKQRGGSTLDEPEERRGDDGGVDEAEEEKATDGLVVGHLAGPLRLRLLLDVLEQLTKFPIINK
jgi:hypothetical protein